MCAPSILQVAGLKDKLAVVLSKTQNDDKLIAALRAELLATTRGQRQAGGSTGRCVCFMRCGGVPANPAVGSSQHSATGYSCKSLSCL